MTALRNAMSIDLEDWFCVSNLSGIIKREDWAGCQSRVVDNTRRILDLLDRHETKATFFVLGWIAERFPNLVREVDSQGHEIATHGYSHRLLTEMSPPEFEDDLQRALDVTQPCARQAIIGFRAPSFSITRSTLWALDILLKKGLRYDSSIYPMGFHPDYGIGDAPIAIHPTNDSLVEFPMSCVEIFGKRIPCSGGGYFRLYPYRLTRLLLRKCNQEGRPFVFYLHPWEVDPDQPRVEGLTALKRFRHYHNLSKTLRRFDALLRDFSFTSVRAVVNL